MKKVWLILSAAIVLHVVVLWELTGYAKRLQPEQYYQVMWCTDHKGQTEVVMEDRTRVDCLTATHAIEFDFASKWAEAIGQSLHYGLMTGKRPAIVLIMEKPNKTHYWYRLKNIINKYKLLIDLWCYPCVGVVE